MRVFDFFDMERELDEVDFLRLEVGDMYTSLVSDRMYALLAVIDDDLHQPCCWLLVRRKRKPGSVPVITVFQREKIAQKTYDRLCHECEKSDDMTFVE